MTRMNSLPIPSIDTATDPIVTPADLRQRWRALVGPLGFGERLLRFSFVGPDRRLVKLLSEVPIGRSPTPAMVDGLMSTVEALVNDVGAGGTVAFLLTRPGLGSVSRWDRQWADALVAGAAERGVAIEPVFRAHDHDIALVAPQSLAVYAR
jgi:DNA-binding transcriptional regulator YdaS (Cro superfamily)